ncbi:MAG: hypothetical protein JWN70_4488 [Planctomycetaceae bacterium]|nr:hypothetical protein [Planctomycetaceae bacterium]
MRLVHQTWMSVVLALALVGGCASRSGLEVLESSLRQQEDRLAGLQQQLNATQSELQISQNEVAQLRAQLAANGEQSHAPEHFENEFKAVGLRFNAYLTSGIDRDGYPGDDGLSVLLYPHDEQGGLVKLAGTVELRAVDLSAPDGQQEIGSWSYTPEQTKKSWHTGFLAAGFMFDEAWERLPQGANITLHARFKTLDGRQFDAVQPLKVTVPAAGPLAQVPPLQTKVRASKPTISPVGYDARKDRDEGDLAAELEDEGNGNQGVIETSDRYREHELPVIR